MKHIKLFENWMNEAEMSIPAGHIAAVIINDESGRMSPALTNWIKQNAIHMSLDNMDPEDFARNNMQYKDLGGKMVIFTGYKQAMPSVKQIVDKMNLKTLDAATTEIEDLALSTSKGLSLNTNVKIVKMNESFNLDEANTYMLRSITANMYEMKDMSVLKHIIKSAGENVYYFFLGSKNPGYEELTQEKMLTISKELDGIEAESIAIFIEANAKIIPTALDMENGKTYNVTRYWNASFADRFGLKFKL